MPICPADGSTSAVGDDLLGRVVDPLGNPLDGRSAPQTAARRPLDVASPPIVVRDFVNRPLYTGNKIVDTLIPIGKGQRQLIIGDNGSGKSALAIDAVINQKGKNVLCVYVLIGQKRSSVLGTLETLPARRRDRLHHAGGRRGHGHARAQIPGALRRLHAGRGLDRGRAGTPW